MGRRASSSLNATAIIGIAVVLLILIGGGFIILKGKGKSTFDAPPLRMEDVLENANSLRGNEYRVEGKVSRREVRDAGEAVTIMVEDGSQAEPLLIVIPPEISNINIERDIKYAFKVRFGEGGVPIATGVKRL